MRRETWRRTRRAGGAGLLAAGIILVGAAAPARAAPRAPAKPKPAAKPAPAPSTPKLLDLEVRPASVLLDGPRAEQTVLVTGRYADGSYRDVSGSARWTPAKSPVVTLDPEAGALRPLRDGEATLTVSVDGRNARVPVRVTGTASPRPVSFVNDVMPVVTKAGCNQASCHGAQSGKGGFRLSLFGYDPGFDYQAIADKATTGGKERIDRTAPDQSLLLQKGIAAVSHGGGRRLVPASLPYRVLRDWIAGGAPVPSTSATLTRLDVSPDQRIFPQPGNPQRLLVRAVYSDGTERDVTSLARYDAQDPDAVEVTENGTVTPTRRGATSVMVRYAGQVATFRAQVPFTSGTDLRYPAPVNAVDEKVFARLRELALPLSEAAPDLEFLRRASLDLTGTLPKPEEVLAFSQDRDPEKRRKKIDALLERDDHVYFWTQRWSDLFKVNSRDLGQPGMLAYYGYLLESVRVNKPWDRLAREMVLSRPGAQVEGSYYLTSRTAEDRAMTTAEVFLGVRIQCAQCHQHPFETWSQDDFWQFASFFAKVPGPTLNRPGILGKGLEVPQAQTTTEVTNPRTKQPAFPPKLLGGATVMDPDSRGDRREPLAQWLTAPENPWFARAFVNRVWRHLFGRGIIDPVDDVRVTNPPSDPALLDALAREFVVKGYDVRALMRMICNSRTYQTASRPLPGNKDDNRFFSHAYFRRLSAEQLADAIAHATGIQDDYPGYEPGLRAIQLPDPQIAAPFLDAFGRPGRTQSCECERTNDTSVAQALRLITGPGLSNKATAGNGRIARMMFFTEKKPDEIWEELYLWSLSRPPTAAERQAWKEHVGERMKAMPDNKSGVTQEALEDWFWALLNSKEFLFNH